MADEKGGLMAEKIIVYGHPTCPMMPAVFGMLKQSQVEYDYINIHQDDEARVYVREVNNGYESVPTLRFPDGTTLTEPSPGQLRRKLVGLGYDVPRVALVYGNWHWIVIGVGVLLAVLRAFGVI